MAGKRGCAAGQAPCCGCLPGRSVPVGLELHVGLLQSLLEAGAQIGQGGANVLHQHLVQALGQRAPAALLADLQPAAHAASGAASFSRYKSPN